MVLSTVLAAARAIAQTDSEGLTDANGIIFANEALNDFHRRLVRAGVDASQLQESFQMGTANTGTYLYPTDMLFLKAIEVDYSGSGGQSYLTANQIDVSNLPGGSFSWLRVHGDVSAPQFDDRGDWFELFPTPTIAPLIRIFYYIKPLQYSATSDTVSYPENMDQNILAYRIAANYKRSLTDFDSATSFDNEYLTKVKDYIATIGRGVQQPLKSTPIQLTGFEF